MRRFATAVLLLALALPSAAEAARHKDVFLASQLYEMCTSSYDTDYGYCAGYVSSVAHQLLSQDVAGYRACNHSIVRSQQFIDIFRAYSETHAEAMSAEAGTVVAAALARAFPCFQ